jgi:ubiquinone/menaquinone biosynthesis C-methylase UbiE
MNIYEEYCLPHIINCACGMGAVEKQRAKIVPGARGKVLEIGMGSGLNLKHYNADQVEMVWGLEPSEGMRRKAQPNIDESKVSVEWLGLPSEKIPLADNSADTVVLTYTLCTIADWQSALAEMHRVLSPDGQLLFCEHGNAPDAKIQTWQRRINPIWKKIAGGCNLNRKIPQLISSAGFKIDQLDECYIDGPKIAAYQYFGIATI